MPGDPETCIDDREIAKNDLGKLFEDGGTVFDGGRDGR